MKGYQEFLRRQNFANVDVSKELPVVPTVHYNMGGIPKL